MTTDHPVNAQLSGARILLVEDDESTCKLYERRLLGFGITLTHARTAEEGVRCLRQTEFDVLILDLSLPASHGAEVLEALDAERIELPVVIITGSSDIEHARRVLPYPISSYHLKGTETLDRLPEIVGSALQSFELRRARDEARKERSRLEFFLERSGWLYVFIDVEGLMQEINPAVAEAFGFDEAEIIGKPFWNLLHASLHEEAKARWPEFVAGRMPQQPWLITHKCSDGELVTVEWSHTPYEGAAGEVRGVIVFGRVVTERREAELRARVLFEEALTGIALIDKNTLQVVEINNVGAAYFGDTARSMKGQSIVTLFERDDRTLFEKKLEQIRASSDAISGEARVTRADGSQFVLGYRASLIVVGSRHMVLILCRDLTEILEVENKYRELFQRSLQPIFLIDSDGVRIEDCNPAFERLVGRPREELLGVDVMELLEPGERTRLAAVIESRRNSDQSTEFETTLLRPDGRRLWIAGKISSFRFAGRALLMTFMRDLTGEKQAADRYQKIFLHGYDPIVIFDETRQHVIDANPAFLELSGYTLEVLRQRSRADFLEDSPVDARTHGGRQRAMLRTESGDAIPVSYRYSDLAMDGSPNSMLTLHDLRPELHAQELERSLTQVQRMQALGQMASGIAHDFNNTLMAALPWADLLRRKYPNDETIQKSADQIRKAVHRAKDVTRQLLDFAQPKLPERKRINLAEHLAGEMKILRPALSPEVAIQMTAQEGDFIVNADPAQLSQVLFNLGLNARDAMRGQGTLTFDLRNLTEAESTRWGVARYGYALIAVRDTGAGMDESTLAKIFDPFFTTKDIGHGAGLGLSVVLRLIEHHGGTLRVESQVGKGTTFYILLPLSDPRGEPIPEPLESPAARYEGLKILLVDDETSIAEGIKLLLEAEGATVMAASRGTEALALVAEGFLPDFVVLDLGLPEMPGEEVHAALRKILPDVPVLIASGYGDRERIGALLRDGNTRFQQKPYEIQHLFREIDWFMARQQKKS